LLRRHKPLNRCLGMLRGEVTVSLSHLYCTVAHELGNGPNVYTSRDQTGCEGVAIAMPSVVLDSSLLDGTFKPIT
jgi:hypothetical protein